MTLLPEVERAVLDAIVRDQAAKRRSRLERIRAKSLRLPAFAVLALLGTTTAALAGSGVILTGSQVPTHGRERPRYGYGIPVRGASELLPLRAPDPAGGLPWGMRLIRTTRGYLCVQIGRVDHGRLGELGIDGAFNDDGRFHPLPVDALASPALNIDCQPPGKATFSGAIAGLEPNAATNPAPNVGSPASRRTISFGLLGRHARAVTYRSEGGVKRMKVLPGLGAYLTVQRASSGGRLRQFSESLAPEGEPVNPDGALTAITYAFGDRRCTAAGNGNVLSACGFREGPPKAKPLPVVHVPLHVQLEIRRHTVTAAYVVFRAPYAVRSAEQGYSVDWHGCHGSLDGGGTKRDITKGALVHLSVGGDLSNACARSVRISLVYTRSVEDNVVFTPLGKVTVRIPRGDHAPPPPHRNVRQGRGG